jgi:histidinol dehydrogenase
MPLRILDYSTLGDADRARLLERAYQQDEQALETARSILARVRSEGKSAVLALTEQYDGARMSDLLVSSEEWKAADAVAPEIQEAFSRAHRNIQEFHKVQKDALEGRSAVIDGTELGFRYVPVETAAMYVPGGKASYPSSVLMGLVPAVQAGVQNRIVITPPDKEGRVLPEVLYCARLAGATAILKAGGAQGIAAAAFGRSAPGVTVPPAQVVVGPGNRYVTAAKVLLSSTGIVRIDLPAGPSEVLVIADHTANPEYAAADLLSQAEHGEDSMAVLVCTSEAFAREVSSWIARGFEERPARRAMKETSIRQHSYALVVKSIEEAVEFSNLFAPEHLELCVQDPEAVLRRITSAGSVFLGNYAPVALGDYYSGTNHILPTGRAGLAYSGLGVETFMRRITFQHPTRESLKNALDPIMVMSRVEGLEFEHGHSVAVRFRENGKS